MIPATKGVSVTSTLEPEHTIEMSIDPLAAKHLMGILAGIYSDNARAVIREYSTNALDSHVEAGQTRPIEVKSPSRLDPVFEVQDWGVGMSVDDIRNIYALYGASTKRNTQTQTGSIGIGAKSALAFGSQFTVTAIKDGERAVVLVGLNDNGDGVMEVISVVETDEPNGVKISIPVNHDHGNFAFKLKTFHKYVKPGLMLVDGEEADRSEFSVLTDKLTISATGNAYHNVDYVVMGNVYYPIDKNIYSRIHPHYAVVIYADMGEVHFTPSREELTYDKFTLATLDKYKNEFNESLKEYLQGLIEAEENRRLAFNRRQKLSSGLTFEQRRDWVFTYKGEPLPAADSIECKAADWWGDGEGIHLSKTHSLSLIEDNDNRLFIKNWDNVRFTRVHACKVMQFADNEEIGTIRNVVLFKSDFDDQGLFSDIPIYDYNDIKVVKLPGVAGTKGARKKVRDYYGIGGDRPFEKRVPDPTKNLWYGSKKELRNSKDVDWYYRMSEFDLPDHEFYYVADNDTEKFKAAYPKARHYIEFKLDKIRNYLDSITDEDRNTINYCDGVSNSDLLIADELEDPELKKYVAIRNTWDRTDQQRKAINDWERNRNALFKLPYKYRKDLEARFPEIDRSGLEALTDKYPLLVTGSFYSRYQTDVLKRHMTDYCNMVYRAARLEDTTPREDA